MQTYPPQPAIKTHWSGVHSLWLGLVSVVGFLPPVSGVLAILFGIWALSEVVMRHGKGLGVTVWGIALGTAGLFFYLGQIALLYL